MTAVGLERRGRRSAIVAAQCVVWNAVDGRFTLDLFSKLQTYYCVFNGTPPEHNSNSTLVESPGRTEPVHAAEILMNSKQ